MEAAWDPGAGGEGPPVEDSEVEDETFLEVARILRRGWLAALAEQFPDRRVVVELLDSEDDWHGPTLYLTSAPPATPAI
jgi:hypothetical protein